MTTIIIILLVLLLLGVAGVAAQPRVGLLSKRRVSHFANYRADIVDARNRALIAALCEELGFLGVNL